MTAPQNPREKEIEQVEEDHKEEDEKDENKTTAPPSSPSNSTSTSPFAFWFYATALVTILGVLLSALHTTTTTTTTTTTPDSWFLSLPSGLHLHYSSGFFVKTQLSPNHSLTQVFTIDRRPKGASTAGETVLLVHGLGCASFSFRHVVGFLVASGFRAVAVDLPGSGFSDLMEEGEQGRKVGGVWGKVLRVYKDVKEKGLFWGFDHLVEMGYAPYGEEEEENEERRRVSDGMRSDAEMGRILGQVIDSLGLASLHLVAHDSATGAIAKLVAHDSGTEAGLVRSVTILDSSPGSSAFPSWVLGVPLMGEVVLRSRWAFAGLLRLCCSRSINESAAEAYRVMLTREGRRSAVVDAGKSLNHGFDSGHWSGSEELKDLPVQVLWSHMTSDLWIQEGKRVAAAVPGARFVPHLGGRWPQEGAAEEIAGEIGAFISSLPASHSQVEQESGGDDEQEDVPDEANADDHQHSSHGDEYAAGYMGAYGLGNAWES